MRKGMPNGKLHADYGASEPFTRAEPGAITLNPLFQACMVLACGFQFDRSGPETGGLR
ncbi:MAG: hypothetical protein CM1200mP9_10450 [Gammaproteobacteria bacterium]|nr:MAG: hypothetical protein CM1200mP9_10450 [Gammaproteobacteria bacterium]